jgi:hypothetical protein
MKSGTGQIVPPERVARIRIAYRLPNRRMRLRQQGTLSAQELSEQWEFLSDQINLLKIKEINVKQGGV